MLDNVSIDVSSVSDASAFDMTAATVNLTLKADTTNTLKSNGTAAGLQAPADATLSITSGAGDNQTSGILNAYGGLSSDTASGSVHSGAGIGGGEAQDGGAITIAGGTVNAYGFYSSSVTGTNRLGAGIGGGGNSGSAKAGNGGKIEITGGSVTAVGGGSNTTAGEGAAGIGGGAGYYNTDNSGGTGGEITISGGTVNASSKMNGAGIGGGYKGAGGTIKITNGTVTATGGPVGAGIGGGNRGNGGSIAVSGGAVTATSTLGTNLFPGAGIGGGGKGAGGTITINGTSVSDNGQGTTVQLGTIGNGPATGTATGITTTITEGNVDNPTVRDSKSHAIGAGGT